MKYVKRILPFVLLVFTVAIYSQDEVSNISMLRQASNEALKSYDHEKVLSFLTEDVMTTTGAGTLLRGK